MSKYKFYSFITIVFCIFSGQVVQGIDDPWILFDRSDHVLHGTVIQVVEGERDRLYQITSENEQSFGSHSSSSWWLREPEGASTEGIGAAIGFSGAWLVADAIGGEFPDADATVLPGGLLPVLHSSDTVELVRLKTEEHPAEVALQLIQSKTPVIRRIAIGWWRTTNVEPETEQQEAIDWAFGGETNPSVQKSWLELYLQRGWIFENSGLADLIPFAEDPAVSMLATAYLQERGTVRQRARLVSAWPSANLEAKKRLAIAYRKLAIAEAGPWLLQGITSVEPSLKFICIESLGGTGADDIEDTFSALLHSTSAKIRASALRGLAQNRTPGSWQLLNETIASMESTDPLREMAISLKKHPWKLLKTRGRR
ncbi:MAG: hypothetical protein CMJ95_07060 [Planctomycetes bacterium]|nr:hypothetical protein [Planctomycetota bacterium]